MPAAATVRPGAIRRSAAALLLSRPPTVVGAVREGQRLLLPGAAGLGWPARVGMLRHQRLALLALTVGLLAVAPLPGPPMLVQAAPAAAAQQVRALPVILVGFPL